MKFFAHVEHGLAYLDYRPFDEGSLEYFYTFVPVEDRGRGIAGRLVDHAFRYAAAQGFRVLPTCPFIAIRARRNPEFREMIIEG